jgi:putative membrane protein
MKYLASGLALVLLVTPAMAQSVGEKTGVNSTLGISPTTADLVKEAATSDMFEIRSSQLAQERGNASEKTFAATMIKDHTKTSEDLKSMISSGDVKVELPTALDSSHQSEIDKLKSLKSADFSSRYDDDQVSGHKDAVSLFALLHGRRQSEAQGLGGQDPADIAASSRDGPGLEGRKNCRKPLGGMPISRSGCGCPWTFAMTFATQCFSWPVQP